MRDFINSIRKRNIEKNLAGDLSILNPPNQSQTDESI